MLIHSIKFCFHTARKLCAPVCLISKLFKELIGIIQLHRVKLQSVGVG